MIIDKNDISKGLQNKAIGFIRSPHNDGIVCQIGEHWFYFGGKKAAEYDDPEEWSKHVTRREVIDHIFDALWDLQHDGDKPSDEWFYYFYYLHEWAHKINCDEIRKILEKNEIDKDGEWGWLYDLCDYPISDSIHAGVVERQTHQT